MFFLISRHRDGCQAIFRLNQTLSITAACLVTSFRVFFANSKDGIPISFKKLKFAASKI